MESGDVLGVCSSAEAWGVAGEDVSLSLRLYICSAI